MSIKWEDRYAQLSHLPEFALFSLARNEAAPIKYRRTALEIMVQKGFKSAENPIFKELGLDFEVIEEPEAVPEQEYTGPLKASVTTETLYGNKIEEYSNHILDISNPDAIKTTVDLLLEEQTKVENHDNTVENNPFLTVDTFNEKPIPDEAYATLDFQKMETKCFTDNDNVVLNSDDTIS